MFRFSLRHARRSLARNSIRYSSTRSLSPIAKLGAASFLTTTACFWLSSQSIFLDNSVSSDNTVSVDSGIDAFPTFIPKTLENLHEDDYKLVGFGVRSVTFVGFKVYGIGLYIAESEIAKAKSLFKNESNRLNKSLHDLLKDNENSVEVIDHLLKAGVRFMVRINPIRNTDYNHMRDGLVKSVLAHKESKIHREEVGEGLDQLRLTFLKHRGSVPKNHLLFLEVLPQGKLRVVYENTQTKTSTLMGEVDEALISRVLFLLYLSGKKPLSEPLRASCIEGFLRL